MTVIKTLVDTDGYGWTLLGPISLKREMDRAIRAFKILKEKMQIDAIAFSGSSGAALAFPLALRYKIPLIYVRKQGEKSHGTQVEVNTTDHLRTYVIVDDFVSSGETVQHIISSIGKKAKTRGWAGPKCLGVYCYSEGEQHSNDLILSNGKKLSITKPSWLTKEKK